MRKEDFLKGYKEVMGIDLTWENFIAGLLMVIGGMLVLMIGEAIDGICNSVI